jgi:hypothetical protein
MKELLDYVPNCHVKCIRSVGYCREGVVYETSHLNRQGDTVEIHTRYSGFKKYLAKCFVPVSLVKGENSETS